jgi:TPR repeat protein
MKNKIAYMRGLLISLMAFMTFLGCTSNVRHNKDVSNEQIFPKMLVLAKQGSAEAQYFTGMFYNNGIGIEKNYQKAFEWFQKSNLSGHPLGAYKLGCYFSGQFNVIPVDKEKALKYKLISAKAGYSRAQYDVGGIYFSQLKYNQALQWFKDAASQGHYPATYLLANMYKNDDYIQKDYILSYFYTKLALNRSSSNDSIKLHKNLNELNNLMVSAEVGKANSLLSSWKTRPTALTIDANSGMKTAHNIVRYK